MNKVLITSLTLGVVAVIGVSIVFLNRPQNISEMGESPTEEAQETTVKQSLKELMMQAGSKECVFTDTATNNSGTLYIGDGKSRGDILTQIEGTTRNSHMIYDGKMVYVWADGQTQGVQMDISSMESAENPGQNVDINKQVDFTCKGWMVNQSFFTPPTTVAFEDLTTMMEGVSKMMDQQVVSPASDTSSQCTACDNLPDEAKVQCKTALNCK